MKKLAKRIASVAAAAVAAVSLITLSACMQGPAGPAGPMGQDLDFYDLFDAVNAERAENGQSPLTVSEFVKEYFGYVSDESQQAVSEQAVMNYSLLSSVAILADYTSGSSMQHDIYSGSGVIIDIDREAGDAYIVTNSHVVYEPTSREKYCDSIYVYLYGSDEMYYDYNLTTAGVINYNGIPAEQVKLVGISFTYDLALLKVEGSEILKNSRAVAAKFAQDELSYVGERVYAVGNPSGGGLSVSSGIISRDSETISLEIDEMRDYRVMRTDASINGGNSGGGLFNMDGEIVGIVNSGAASVLDGEEIIDIDNISYALPSSYSRRVIQTMIDSYESGASNLQTVGKMMLGVTSTVSGTYSYYDAERGVAVIDETITVQQVQNGSAAFRVLKGNDVIKGFAVGKSDITQSYCSATQEPTFTIPENSNTVAEHYFEFDVTRQYQIQDAMFSVRTGDTVRLTIERDGTTMYAYILYDNSYSYTMYD